MNEFDPNHLNKDFSDQPITSLSDLAQRMRGPQYRSSLASQDARPFSALPAAQAETRQASPVVPAGENALHQSEIGGGWGHADRGPGADRAAQSAEGNPFDAPALQEDGYAWQDTANHGAEDRAYQSSVDPLSYPEPQDAAQFDANQFDANQFDTAAEQHLTGQDPFYGSNAGDGQDGFCASDGALDPATNQVEAPQWDARAIDEEFSDLSPDSREWQKVAWHQEGPVAGHLVTGQLRGSKRADLRAALSFDYAAEDDDDQQAYAPSYRPTAAIPGFARSQHGEGQAPTVNREQTGEQPDLRAVGEALAAERHSAKRASLGYRITAAAAGTWKACRAASMPQIAITAGGVAASVVMALAIWTLLSEPSLREPIYIAAQDGPEKTVPDDPGGMQIANLDVSLLNNDPHDGRDIQIQNDGSTPAIALSLQQALQGQEGGNLESIDDLIQVEQADARAVPGVAPPLQDAASIDQLIELASLDTSASQTPPQPQSLVFDGPPLPRRKEAGHGLPAKPVPLTLGDQTAEAAAARSRLDSQPSSQIEGQPTLAMPGPLASPAPGTVSAAAPLSNQDDLGALVEEMEADPIWQLMLQEEQDPAGANRDLGEGETPAQRHPEETPAAILSGSIDPGALQEARIDVESLWKLDGGRHSQAGMLGNFANWIVPSAQHLGEQLAQLQADGQGGLVGAQELLPEPDQQSAATEDEVVVPDGPWAPPLLPSEAIEPFGLQLASYRSLNTARRSWERFKKKHPSLLQDLVLRVQQVQLAGRGTFYRLQVGPFPNELTALDVCQQLKQRGHRSCIVVK